MGAGSSVSKQDIPQGVFTDLAAEYEKVKGEDEMVQFQQLKKKFQEHPDIFRNKVEPDRKHRGLHKHMHVNFKTLARMVGKLEAAKKHYNKGLRTDDLHFHSAGESFNQVTT